MHLLFFNAQKDKNPVHYDPNPGDEYTESNFPENSGKFGSYIRAHYTVTKTLTIYNLQFTINLGRCLPYKFVILIYNFKACNYKIDFLIVSFSTIQNFIKFYKILQNFKMNDFTFENTHNSDSDDDNNVTASAIDEIDYPEILKDH